MNKLFNKICTSNHLQSIVAWVVMFLLIFIQLSWINVGLSLIITLMTILNMMIVYYVTQKKLAPKLLVKGKRFLFVLSSILMFIPLVYVSIHVELLVFEYFKTEPKHVIPIYFATSKYFSIFILTYTISIITYFSNKTTEDAKQKDELLSEKKLLEARVLKSQINSHFIFNALNNIYSMIYFKDEYTSGYVLKLSQMMRYVMEDCETELTPLSKEIEYIDNFIDFQKLRFENDKDITFTHNITNGSKTLVPPMLFQPFVENCFRHAPLEVDASSYVHIFLEMKERTIYFTAENKQPIIKKKPSSERTGIGIENVKRRLELYFNDNYTLNITNERSYFKVELSINV